MDPDGKARWLAVNQLGDHYRWGLGLWFHGVGAVILWTVVAQDPKSLWKSPWPTVGLAMPL
jgi:hypothetical protein